MGDVHDKNSRYDELDAMCAGKLTLEQTADLKNNVYPNIEAAQRDAVMQHANAAIYLLLEEALQAFCLVDIGDHKYNKTSDGLNEFLKHIGLVDSNISTSLETDLQPFLDMASVAYKSENPGDIDMELLKKVASDYLLTQCKSAKYLADESIVDVFQAKREKITKQADMYEACVAEFSNKQNNCLMKLY